MRRPANSFKKESTRRKKRVRLPFTKGAGKKVARNLHKVLSGSYIEKKKGNSWLYFVFFLVFLGIIYIGNNYLAEKKIREIEKVKGRIKELQINAVFKKSQLTEETRPSAVAKKLEKTGIKPSTDPPEKIIIESKK